MTTITVTDDGKARVEVHRTNVLDILNDIESLGIESQFYSKSRSEIKGLMSTQSRSTLLISKDQHATTQQVRDSLLFIQNGSRIIEFLDRYGADTINQVISAAAAVGVNWPPVREELSTVDAIRAWIADPMDEHF